MQNLFQPSAEEGQGFEAACDNHFQQSARHEMALH